MSDPSFAERLQRIQQERGPEAGVAPQPQFQARPAPLADEDLEMLRTRRPRSAAQWAVIGFFWPFLTLVACACLPFVQGFLSTPGGSAELVSTVMLVMAALILLSVLGIVFMLARSAIEMASRPERMPLIYGIVGGFVTGLAPIVLRA